MFQLFYYMFISYFYSYYCWFHMFDYLISNFKFYFPISNLGSWRPSRIPISNFEFQFPISNLGSCRPSQIPISNFQFPKFPTPPPPLPSRAQYFQFPIPISSSNFQFPILDARDPSGIHSESLPQISRKRRNVKIWHGVQTRRSKTMRDIG